MSVRSLERALVYSATFCGFIGSAVLAVQVGPVHLFPYRVLLLALWGLFVIGVLFHQGRVNVSRIKVGMYLRFLGIWLVYSVFSIGWAASKEAAIRYTIFLFMSTSLVFLTVYYLDELRCLKQLYWIWLLALMALVPIGIWETITGSHLSVSALAGVDHPIVRFSPTTVFHNANDYATYLSLSLPFAFVWIRYSNTLIERLLGGLVVMGGLYTLIATYSRANYLAVLVGAIFWFLLALRLRGKVRVVGLVGLLILALIVAAPDRVRGIWSTIVVQLNMWADYRSQTGPSSLTVRLGLVRNGLRFLVSSFGFGVGAGNVEYHMAESPAYETYGLVNLHNWWMEILANFGVYVFLGYLVFYVALLVNLYRAYKRLQDVTEKMIGEGLLVSLLSFFLASISSSSIVTLTAQWALFAFALAFLNYLRIKAQGERAPEPEPSLV